MKSMTDFNVLDKPDWCPGCGDFSILGALKKSFAEQDLDPSQIFISSGIGCSSKLPHWIKAYGIDSIHGRSLPIATAVKLSNRDLHVLAVGGDGDGYGIGMGHFIHAMRRNVNITYVVHNNLVYGLTTGQTSPTSPRGFKSKSTPFGVADWPINPLALAISSGASFVARAFAGDLNHLTELIIEGMKHNGFAIIDVLQPCVSFNKQYSYDFFRSRVYKLSEIDYDSSNKEGAWKKSWEWGDKIPIGVFYKEAKEDYATGRKLSKTPLCKKDISNVDISRTLRQHI